LVCFCFVIFFFFVLCCVCGGGGVGRKVPVICVTKTAVKQTSVINQSQ